MATPVLPTAVGPNSARTCITRSAEPAYAARLRRRSEPLRVVEAAPEISTSTSSPGAAVPSKLTVLLWRVRPRSREGSVRLGPSTRTSTMRSRKRCARSRARLDELHEALHALALDWVRQLVLEGGGLRAAARREEEGEGAVVADLVDHLEGLLEVRVGLTRKADDDVSGDRAVGDVFADQRHAVHVALPAVGAPHPLQNRCGARLERQVDVLAERVELGVRSDHVLAHVLGVRARVADALDTGNAVHPGEQFSESDPTLLRQVAPVAVHVLAQQGDLAHTVGSQALHLCDQLIGGATRLAAAHRRHDAVGADAVAALRYLHPSLELAGALHRQMPGDVLELEVALRGQRVGGEELCEAVDLTRPEGHVHEREAPEDFVLHRLRPAATHPHDPRRILELESLGLAEVGDEAVVGRFTDRAGIEEDQVGALAIGRFDVAEGIEHSLHPLGVVLVHLTAERGDVVAPLHRSQSSGAGPTWRES